jgi:membrane protease YdiL (CAAX protease family)
MFAAFYSQYLVKGFGPVADGLIVYGKPTLAVTLVCGRSLLRNALGHTSTAAKLGISSFGMFELLGSLVGIVIMYAVSYFYPDAEELLDRDNPVLEVPQRFGWLMVFVSIVVIGPIEEYLFRGFVYGGLLSLYRRHHWLALAFLSSMFFAVAHLYYASVYGIASIVAFADLMAFGMAMSFTYYFSGGNLLVPALIHGLYDAGGFLAVAVSPSAGTGFRSFMIFIGIAVAVGMATRSLWKPAARS